MIYFTDMLSQYIVDIIDNDTLSYIIHILNNTIMNCIKFEKNENNLVSISTN